MVSSQRVPGMSLCQRVRLRVWEIPSLTSQYRRYLTHHLLHKTDKCEMCGCKSCIIIKLSETTNLFAPIYLMFMIMHCMVSNGRYWTGHALFKTEQKRVLSYDARFFLSDTKTFFRIVNLNQICIILFLIMKTMVY